MRVIWSGPGTPRANMAEDLRLLDDRGEVELVLRFYTWRPIGLSLGHFQGEPPTALLESLRGEDFECVRRMTGGGAIIHADELTYALIGSEGQAPFRGSVMDSYAFVHEALIEVLASFGVAAGFASDAPPVLPHRDRPYLCFARTTALDLVSRGKKIVGSAKRRRHGRALQHGSILLSAHPLQTGAIGVNDLLGRDAVHAQQLADRVASQLADALAK